MPPSWAQPNPKTGTHHPTIAHVRKHFPHPQHTSIPAGHNMFHPPMSKDARGVCPLEDPAPHHSHLQQGSRHRRLMPPGSTTTTARGKHTTRKHQPRGAPPVTRCCCAAHHDPHSSKNPPTGHHPQHPGHPDRLKNTPHGPTDATKPTNHLGLPESMLQRLKTATKSEFQPDPHQAAQEPPRVTQTV